jgi:CHAT domain-containing protein
MLTVAPRGSACVLVRRLAAVAAITSCALLRIAAAQADDPAAAARERATAGDYAGAIERLTEALAGQATSGAERASLLNDLGTAQVAVDDTLAGLAAFADAAELAPAPSALGVTARLNFARALAEAGVRDGESARLAALRELARGLPASATQAELLIALAQLHREAGEAGGGRELLDHAHALAADALTVAEANGSALLRAEAHGELGLANDALGAHRAALADTRAAVLLAQSAGAPADLYRWQWQTGRSLRALGDEAGALRAYRAAIETLSATPAAATQPPSAFARNVLQLYEEYADLALRAARSAPPESAASALLEVQRTLESLRVAEVRNYFENQCVVPEVFDLRSANEERVVVVYTLVFPDRTEVLVSSGGRLRQITVDVELARLAGVINELRIAVEDPSSGDAYLGPARQIYSWLIEPLEPTLAAADATTLIVVPDGPLRTIPFAVLHDDEGFLVERYALGITPALSLVGAVNAQPISRVLANGIIAPTNGFAGLPFVAQELDSIAAAFPARVYVDDSFVTQTLEREMVEGGYSAVHMATHAQFESDYRRSFLLAHDDVITMDELEDAVGAQRFSDQPVDLLVLSACRTAAGDERAALGLAGVAVKAGARSALASLWAVNDESTASLVGEFYRQLAGGAGKAAALRGAQLALLNDARHAHPAFWAPFLMIGDWR